MKTPIYTYTAVFLFADDGITVYFPDFPGCISQGDSLEEAMHMAREALAIFIDDFQEKQKPLPHPGSTPHELEEGERFQDVTVDMRRFDDGLYVEDEDFLEEGK